MCLGEVGLGMAGQAGSHGTRVFVSTPTLSFVIQCGRQLTVATELPTAAEGMVSRIGPVTNVTELGAISNTNVYRNSFVPAIDTNGISVSATDAALPATLGATVAHGTFLNAATAHFPASPTRWCSGDFARSYWSPSTTS